MQQAHVFFNNLLCGVLVGPAGGRLNRHVRETPMKLTVDKTDARRK